ncbi:MAG: hypothetical protein O3C40_18850 [Planctomycetota bacterium]|nr:hypothetical protein [Planctomycetota bacterium]
MIKNIPPRIEFVEVTDPDEIRQAKEQRRQFDRNREWLRTRVPDVFERYRGKVICVSAQELFAADTAEEAIAAAKAAHPEEKGWFTRIIPREKVPRIYAF